MAKVIDIKTRQEITEIKPKTLNEFEIGWAIGDLEAQARALGLNDIATALHKANNKLASKIMEKQLAERLAEKERELNEAQ